MGRERGGLLGHGGCVCGGFWGGRLRLGMWRGRLVEEVRCWSLGIGLKCVSAMEGGMPAYKALPRLEAHRMEIPGGFYFQSSFTL